MIDYSIQNKKAWEYNAYDFWVKEAGMPADRAKKIVANSVSNCFKSGFLRFRLNVCVCIPSAGSLFPCELPFLSMCTKL